MKFATKAKWQYPPYPRHVATLAWEIKHSNFLQIFSRYGRKCKQIAFLIASNWLRIIFFLSLFYYSMNQRERLNNRLRWKALATTCITLKSNKEAQYVELRNVVAHSTRLTLTLMQLKNPLPLSLHRSALHTQSSTSSCSSPGGWSGKRVLLFNKLQIMPSTQHHIIRYCSLSLPIIYRIFSSFSLIKPFIL